MNAKQALTRVVDDIDDMDSFVGTFDPEFWQGDDTVAEIAEAGKDIEVVGRFGENAQTLTTNALKVLEATVNALEELERVWAMDRDGLEDEHLEAVDKVLAAYRGPWGAEPELEVIA